MYYHLTPHETPLFSLPQSFILLLQTHFVSFSTTYFPKISTYMYKKQLKIDSIKDP